MINKDMTVGEVLRSCSDAAMDAVVKIFTDMGMHCLFCPHSTAETLEEAAMVHGNDVDELVAKLNTVFQAKSAQTGFLCPQAGESQFDFGNTILGFTCASWRILIWK